jgi:DNA-binding NarL/FixJ family response regulator
MRAGAEKRDRSDIKVLVADDQKIVREGLVTLLGLLPWITVIGAATDGEDAVCQALELRPDVVLMDLNMPHCNGVEATERLRRLRPDGAVVVLTTYSDDAWVFAALQAGARGFLTKDAGTDEIQRSIMDVAAGHAQLDPAVQRRLLDALNSGDRFAVADADADADEFAGASAPPGTAPYTESPEGLTAAREAEVLTHIAAGESDGKSPRPCACQRRR